MILLNPGPVRLSPRVRNAMQSPELCHREPEFAALQESVRAQLLAVYGLDPRRWSAVLLTGSGTAAVEAMLISLVPQDGRLLTLENGVYGERMSYIALTHGIAGDAVRTSWSEALSIADVREAIARHPRTTHLAVVHHETTTGRLNRIDALADLCRERGIRLLLDAVSSFGAESIGFDTWGLAACAGTAGKCLHGVPGLAFVIVDRESLASACRPPRSAYLDLVRHATDQESGGTAFTPAIPAYHALHASLLELEEDGGWRARRQRYATLAGRIGDELVALGVEPYVDPVACSAALRSYRLPDGIGYAELHDQLKQRGFVIYAGQGGLEKILFRVSTLGEISDADVQRFVQALREIVPPK